ncbi:MAG: hypothetical protein ACK4WJ_06530 [Endomicrobiia bacterium]
MKNGDISNNPAPIFAVRLEDFLLTFEQEGILNKIMYFGDRKYFNPKIKKYVVNVIDKIFRNTNYSVYVVHSILLNRNIRKILNSLPISQIFFIEKDDDLFYYLDTGFFSYYIDNEKRVDELKHKRIITLKEAYTLIK